MNDKKIGFIIAGAGALIPQELALAYHLIEEKGIVPEVLAGTSSGSLSSTFLNGILQNKAGKGNFNWETLKTELGNLSNDQVYTYPEFITPSDVSGFVKAMKDLADFFKADNFFEKAGDFLKIISEYSELKKCFPALLTVWNEGYLFDTAPLRETLSKYVNSADFLGYARFDQYFVPTHVSAVDYVDGKSKRFYSKNSEDGPNDPVDILMASTAIPVAFPSQKVEDIPYIDGGTATDNIPVEDMIENGKFDEVYIIAPQNPILITGQAHTMTNMPLISNMVFTLQVMHASITPYQIARSMQLVDNPENAYFYMPSLAENYNMLDFTGATLTEQYNETLQWAQTNQPRIARDFLEEIGFPTIPAPTATV